MPTEADIIKIALINLIAKQIGCPTNTIIKGANEKGQFCRMTIVLQNMGFPQIELYVYDDHIVIAEGPLVPNEIADVPLSDPQAISKIADIINNYDPGYERNR